MRPWTRWQDWVTVVIGVAAVVAAFAFAELWTAEMNTVAVLGVVLVVASLVALARPESMGDRWLVGIAGLLLVVAPWVIGYTDLTSLAWTSWIGGAVTVVMEALAMPKARHIGGAQPHG